MYYCQIVPPSNVDSLIGLPGGDYVEGQYVVFTATISTQLPLIIKEEALVMILQRHLHR